MYYFLLALNKNSFSDFVRLSYPFCLILSRIISKRSCSVIPSPFESLLSDGRPALEVLWALRSERANSLSPFLYENVFLFFPVNKLVTEVMSKFMGLPKSIPAPQTTIPRCRQR